MHFHCAVNKRRLNMIDNQCEAAAPILNLCENCVWNNVRKAKDREDGNNKRGEKACEWREMIHILQTDKLLQQQWWGW